MYILQIINAKLIHIFISFFLVLSLGSLFIFNLDVVIVFDFQVKITQQLIS